MRVKADSLRGKARIRGLSRYSIVLAFALFFIFLSLYSNRFLTASNMMNVLRQSTIIGIIACGMTFIIISGNFDLSVGATAAFAGALAIRISNDYAIWAAVLLTLIFGAAVGFTNGILITKLYISSFIVTLGMMVSLKGLTLMFLDGHTLPGTRDGFSLFGQGYVWIIPMPIVIFIVVVVLAHVGLGNTRFGRHVYATGGNMEASALSGIYVDRVRVYSFMLSGVLASLSGIVLASRVNVAHPRAAENYELDAISAVVIGGTSILGGEGSIWRTVVGVIFLTILGNGFNILNVNIFMQYFFKGLIIISAVGIDTYTRYRNIYRV
jgi:ribose transport system permease protein